MLENLQNSSLSLTDPDTPDLYHMVNDMINPDLPYFYTTPTACPANVNAFLHVVLNFPFDACTARWSIKGKWWMKQVEGNEEYHGVIDDPSSALEILFQGLIFVIRERERERT